MWKTLNVNGMLPEVSWMMYCPMSNPKRAFLSVRLMHTALKPNLYQSSQYIHPNEPPTGNLSTQLVPHYR